MNYFLLMMGGCGSRFGEARPKQYTLIEDAPLFAHILKKVDGMDCIDRIVIVSHEAWLDYVREWGEKTVRRIPFEVAAGGDCRSESVLHGLEKAGETAAEDDVVLIHDATHPYADEEGIRRVIEAVQAYGGATLASRNYDTVYEQDDEGNLRQVLPRNNVVAGASPEGFLFGKIYEIYKNATSEELNAMTSAGAIALAHHIPMKVIPTDLLNLKITYKRDMELFTRLCKGYFFDA